MDEAIIENRMSFSLEMNIDVTSENVVNDEINDIENQPNKNPLKLSFYKSGQSLCLKARLI
jgi:hypothetical protein